MAKRSDERAEFLHGVFTTALEGGIGYWSVAEDYHIWLNPGAHWSALKADIHGFSVTLEPNGECDDELGRPCWGAFTDDEIDAASIKIDIDVIATGVARFVEWMEGVKRNNLGGIVKPESDKEWLREPANPGNEYFREFLKSNRTNGKEGDFDADVADAVVQLAIFNEVVYG